jgi:DNA-binding NtrC family response regulator
MRKSQVRTVLVIGDDASVQRALGGLVARAVTETGRGQGLVITATDDVEVLRALSRGQIDVVVADYRDEGRGTDLLAWLSYGKFPTRTLLVSSQGPWGVADYWRAKGIDAVIKRPATLDGLKTLITDWFP